MSIFLGHVLQVDGLTETTILYEHGMAANWRGGSGYEVFMMVPKASERSALRGTADYLRDYRELALVQFMKHGDVPYPDGVDENSTFEQIVAFLKEPRQPKINQPHENRKTFLIDRPNRFPTSATIATKEQETVDSRLTKRVRDW